MAAGCLLLSACGKDAKQGTEQPVATPAAPSETGGNSMEDNKGNAKDENNPVSDEELAQGEAVYDAMAGYIMYQGVYYEIMENNEVRIPDYYDIDITELIIPDEIVYEGNNYQVVEIGEEAFASMYGLEKVVMGNNVRTLGKSAFDNCSDLQEVILNGNLRNIGEHAFNGCEMLVRITIPEGVVSIGEEAFCSCYALKEIDLPETLQTLGDNLFFDCAALESIKIPASIGTIPYGMFTNCSGLSKVEIADGMLVIGKEVFWACEALTEIVIPKSITYIADQAFYSSGLRSITFLGGNITLGQGLFDFCDDFAMIYTREETADYYKSALEEYETEFGIVE